MRITEKQSGISSGKDRGLILRNLILDACSSKPNGIQGIHLWNRIRKHTLGFTIPEFEDMLSSLRTTGVLVCTNKLWWITDYAKNNWQEAKTG